MGRLACNNQRSAPGPTPATSDHSYEKCTKSSDDLHNNRPHLRAMGPLRFTYVPYAE